MWWIILGGSQTNPFSVLDWLGIPNPQEFVGFMFPVAVVGHPLQPLTFSCCFQDAPHFLCGITQPPLLSDGFMDSVISSDERPLDTYRFYIHCTWQPSPLCSCLFATASPFKHCFVLIELSFLTLCCRINSPVSFFYFSILPYFVLDQPVWIVLVYFLGTCLCWRQMLLSDAELIQLKEVGFI